MLTVAVLAAVAGAFCYAAAAALQHQEARSDSVTGELHPRLLWQLAHRPLWLAAFAATAMGASLHLLALSRGPVTFVQPLGVLTLVFAVPLAAVLGRHRMRLRELICAVTVLAGLVSLLNVLGAAHGQSATIPGAQP